MRSKFMKKIIKKITPKLTIDDLFPSLEEELKPCVTYCTGNILNAGSGERDISTFIDGTIINQDIPDGLHNANTNIYSPLHNIPIIDGYFDTIICNAVLEHVRNPSEVMREFNRVCKVGGYLILAIPFMQPEHCDPTDYQRYTYSGIEKLAVDHGFKVVKIEPVHSVYTTVGWIIINWLESRDSVDYFLLKIILYPYIKYMSKKADNQVHSIASVYRLIGIKEKNIQNSE